ncbi:hypothetical protein [Paraburkholderia fungorum]|jgi:hypothetical protein|nr:hypothetical protein [Paraburkholderia fungorum]
MKTLLICVSILILVACKKDDNITLKARTQDNLAPVPASQFGSKK